MSDLKSMAEMFGSSGVDTFLGLPACTNLDMLEARAAILGVPVATPYRSVGNYCTNAPEAIREAIAPYAANLQHVDFDFGEPLFPGELASAVDCGNLAYDESDFAANRAAIKDAVITMVRKGAVPVLLGGDDSVPIPMFDAFAGAGDYTILQIDAHIDWRDQVQGERYGLSSNMRRASEMAHIKKIIQVGQRSIGSARPSDLRDAKAWGVEFYSARDVSRDGLAPVLDAIAEQSNVIIALDIDGLDPSIVPGVIGRAPGGLGYWQTVELIHGVASKARLSAFNLVEFMPERDVDQLGALVCARLIANVLGVVARAKS